MKTSLFASMALTLGAELEGYSRDFAYSAPCSCSKINGLVLKVMDCPSKAIYTVND